MTKQETINVLQSIEDRAADFPNMTECDWVAIAAAKRHLTEVPVSDDLEDAAKNNMIEEAYVSFKVAKLLNEKGFNKPTLAYAYGQNMIDYYSRPKITDSMSIEAGRIPLPTQQMAMRWLREVHHIVISVYPISRELPITEDTMYTCDIATPKHSSQWGHLRGIWHTYEEACDDALEYALKFSLND